MFYKKGFSFKGKRTELSRLETNESELELFKNLIES
jgi:hypothetical protein